MINKNSPIPIYHQLEEYIKQQIENNDLKPGDVLPSEREFAETYNISRMTVRQAITNLVNDQLLYRIKGKGTFVMGPKFEQKLHGLTSFTEEMRARGMQTSSKLLHFEIVPANNELASQLNIPEYAPVYEIKRIRLAEDIPMALERTYIPANLVMGITEDIVQHSLYQYIENNLQLKITDGFQVIEAAIATEEEVTHLQIEKNAPILLMQRTTNLENKHTLEVVKSSYRADRYKFMIDLVRH
ncbi:UTRA domain-containing protein [Agaribacter marinus]|uniref:GntR family transcriptional regulator n=1 Tax=Virgibacillus salarius TaxID=447199 RepID=A0A941DRH0_9BACI|nr:MULTISPECIES: GntR family transcriptional regulator [Bacillaceae]MBR7795699.1 GntR family transcriptional regulator [Virgibacillus salarius]NAZ08412.1 UTRA domain-containing protein [Agaribacter marinus]